MIVITLSVCPPSLRGDITRWLFEIDTGVYVGKVSARVRDKLWERIGENIGKGRATMVFNTNNEQGFDFRVHNTLWEPRDIDGIKLMMRPAHALVAEPIPKHFSKAAKFALAGMARRKKATAAEKSSAEREATEADVYIVLDIETNGLLYSEDSIIEICVQKVANGELCREYHAYIAQDKPLPRKITQLTGITDEMLSERGVAMGEALKNVKDIIGSERIVAHNAAFDLRFLNRACKEVGIAPFDNEVIDTLALARETMRDVMNYKLGTLAKRIGVLPEAIHNSRSDCEITRQLYEYLRRKVKEEDGK